MKSKYIRRRVAAGVLLFAMGTAIGININAMANDTEQPEELITQEVEVAEIAEYDPYALTAEERDLIERVVAAEARGESFEGKCAVAQVIRNRAENWDKPIMEILTATGQFATPYQGEITEDIKQAVGIVYDYGNIEYVDGRTTHFHADYVSPSWASSKTVDRVIGGHIFYY